MCMGLGKIPTQFAFNKSPSTHFKNTAGGGGRIIFSTQHSSKRGFSISSLLPKEKLKILLWSCYLVSLKQAQQYYFSWNYFGEDSGVWHKSTLIVFKGWCFLNGFNKTAKFIIKSLKLVISVSRVATQRLCAVYNYSNVVAGGKTGRLITCKCCSLGGQMYIHIDGLCAWHWDQIRKLLELELAFRSKGTKQMKGGISEA